MPDVMTIAGIALKTSLLIAVAGLLAISLRRQSAAFKHVLWTSALALCVLMPFAVLFLPSHTVATLQPIPPSLAPSLPSSAGGGGLGWGSVFAIWLVGFSCILLRELLSGLALARWRRDAHPVSSARWTASLETLNVRNLRIFESRHIASPCTWGFLRPVLLLPTAGDAWPESARRSALLHELAHVRRLDAASTLIARLACAVHWYNPLVWIAAQRVRNLQERACDDAVLRAGAMPSEYAQFLLDVAAHMSGMSRPTRLAIGMAHSSLRSRIVAILDPAAARSQPHRGRVIAACASLFAFTLLLATASVAVEPPPRPEKPERAKLPEIPKIPELPQRPTLPELPISVVPAVPAIPSVPPLPPAGPAQ
jgi:beta-lactamase regulating signal transducer with metallopeptidase domain